MIDDSRICIPRSVAQCGDDVPDIVQCKEW
jgi:hypothetical protein